MNSKGGIYNPKGIDCAKLLATSKDGKIIPDFMLQRKDIDLIVELTRYII